MRLIRGHRTLLVIFGVLGLMTFGGTMLDPLSVAWVRDSLDRGPAVYAWLLWTHAVCGIVGTLVVGLFGRRVSPRILIGWASVVAGVATFVKYNVPELPLALALTALTGFTSVVGSVGVDTLLQRSVRDAHRGRVFGALAASSALLSLAGAAAGGIAAEYVGTVTMLNVAAALITISGVVVLRALATPHARAEGSDARHAPPSLRGDPRHERCRP
jgi:MFS family permease